MKSNSHSGRSGSTTVARISLALTCAIALGGCSTVKGWFGDKKGDDKPNEPLALTDITPTVVVSKLWSANAGKGEGRMGVGQRPAVADGRVYAAAVEGGVRAFDLQTGKLVFLSGHIAKKDGKPWVGQLGKDTTTEQGKAAARAIAIDLMGTLHAAVGDLNKVKRIVKVMSLVNSTGDFTEQHLVTNGASELFGEVFGPEVGAHARSAFGVAQIPMGACVEIELIAEIA